MERENKTVLQFVSTQTTEAANLYIHETVTIKLNSQNLNLTVFRWRQALIFQLTFIIEAVDAIDGGTLVVPSEQEEVFWIFDLVSEQKANGL